MGLGGFIAKILSFTRTMRNGVPIDSLKVSRDGGITTLIDHMGPPGDDSPPLDSDYASGYPIEGTGRFVVGGYRDVLNEGTALQGEKRLYSRNLDGGIEAVISLRRDGTVEVENASGRVTLAAEGDVEAENALGSFALTSDGELNASVTTVSIGNGAGSMNLSANGTWDFNGATITPSGDVISAGGISLDLHLTPAGALLDSLSGAVTGVSGPPQ